ncbi:ABC transporter permease [Variovorax sp. Sphag1AA]|uniref:ABC transporter permease n=1 Tax=Variovorax sp. Sphag1AA TaxID=2587027 RepID=UPI0016086E56|nr:ABC transporter permease [Variovorax sp. Sphag1AA]MBB3178384.1 ABC-type nitrate/sulfonate/bicarbonate transport system permease component [Variovorax sp. Sphag1AA]
MQLTKVPHALAGAKAPVAPGHGWMRRAMRQRWFIAIRTFAVFIAFWYAVYLWNNNPLQLPSPLAVVSALWDLAVSGELIEHASISASRLLLALAVAIVLAVPLGFWMGLSRTAEAYIDPVVELLRPISGIAWLPLALFIFGIGNTLPVFIMVYVGFFPILLNTVAGVRQVDRKLISAAQTMGVSRSAMLRHVLVPGALPVVMVGIRLAFAASWAAIVAAELIGSPSGLGFAIEWYRQMLMTPKVFGFIAVIGLVGYLCDVALRALQHKLTPWAEGTELS